MICQRRFQIPKKRHVMIVLILALTTYWEHIIWEHHQHDHGDGQHEPLAVECGAAENPWDAKSHQAGFHLEFLTRVSSYLNIRTKMYIPPPPWDSLLPWCCSKHWSCWVQADLPFPSCLHEKKTPYSVGISHIGLKSPKYFRSLFFLTQNLTIVIFLRCFSEVENWIPEKSKKKWYPRKNSLGWIFFLE